MTESGHKNNAKSRILDVSVSLFSKKGFSGVGVREIAAEADVNPAMISYYFHGKTGILQEIIKRFFILYLPVFENIDDPALPPDVCFRNFIRRLVLFIRDHTELFLLIYNELPLDVPEVADMKALFISGLIERTGGLMQRFGLNPEDRETFAMIGPSIISAIVTQFRLRPVMKQVYRVEPNDRYYNQYIDTISALFLDGVRGISGS